MRLTGTANSLGAREALGPKTGANPTKAPVRSKSGPLALRRATPPAGAGSILARSASASTARNWGSSGFAGAPRTMAEPTTNWLSM